MEWYTILVIVALSIIGMSAFWKYGQLGSVNNRHNKTKRKS